MPNQLTTIKDIDFSLLYQNHLQAIAQKNKTPKDWDSKASNMASNLGEATDPYVKAFITRMNLTGAETLLDIGCGPGTICLPIASHFKQVYALDYSQGMLATLQQVAQQKQITNIYCIDKAWQDDWQEIPAVDIIVVSRAMSVTNLEQAISTLNKYAKQRVYTTHAIDRHFIAEDIIEAIGRTDIGQPNYIYAVNILAQQGYKPRVDFIETALDKPQPADFESFLQSVQWSLIDLTAIEISRLKAYYNERVAKGLPVTRTSRTWAFIWWNTDKS